MPYSSVFYGSGWGCSFSCVNSAGSSAIIGNDNLNTDEDLVNFQNCVLRLSDMTTILHSADLISTIQIPCDWTGEPSETPVFDRFMAALTDGNKKIEALLLEFMGVCLSNVKG